MEKELDDEEECEEDAEQCGRQSEVVQLKSECFILVDRWTRLLALMGDNGTVQRRTKRHFYEYNFTCADNDCTEH